MTKKTYPYIIRHEPMTDDGYISVQIAFNDDMILWFDAYKDDNGDITGDWNQYIFYTADADDMAKKAFQEASNDEIGAYNYATALELAETLFTN